MINIYYNKKLYQIKKEKLLMLLNKLLDKEIDEKKIRKYLKRYNLYNENFLKNINKL